MTALVTQPMVRSTGAAPTPVAAATSDTCEAGNGSTHFAVYFNTNAATRTVTISVTGNEEYGPPKPALGPLTLAALTGQLWIPLHPEMADATGLVTLTLSAAASVTVMIVRTA